MEKKKRYVIISEILKVEIREIFQGNSVKTLSEQFVFVLWTDNKNEREKKFGKKMIAQYR